MQRKLRAPLALAQLAAFIIGLTTVAAAQQAAGNDPPFNINAYRIGERLTYTVNYSNFISAGHIELLVAGRDKFFGHEGIQLKAHVETTGVVNVALLSINNDYTTYVFPDNGIPYRAQHVVRQAGQTSESAIDYTRPAGADALPAQLNAGESAGSLDLLSAVYRIRAMPLAAGSTYFTTVRNQGKEFRAEIKVTGRELIKTNVGSFDAIATRVNVKSGEDYNIRAYFTDDEWHVPVLVTAKYNGAIIHFELAASALTAPLRPAPTHTVIEPTDSRPVAKPTPLVQTSSSPLNLPFKVGEQLNYRVFMGQATTSVGSMSFEIKSRGRFFNRDGLQLTVNAQTIGPAAIGVRDQITSYVDPETLLPFRTEINLSEGKYHSARNYNLDQERGAATSEQPRERIDIPVGTHDVISTFYALRTFDLTIQKPNSISIMALHRPRTLTVKAMKRETIELNGQKIPAIMLQLMTDDPQPDKLQVRIWVGDDVRHLPLRIAAVTDIGPVRADLIVVPATAQ